MTWISQISNASPTPSGPSVKPTSHPPVKSKLHGFVHSHFKPGLPTPSELSQVFTILGLQEAWSKHTRSRKPLSAFLEPLQGMGLTEDRVMVLVHLNRLKLEKQTLMETLFLRLRTKGFFSFKDLSDQALIQWTKDLLEKKKRKDAILATPGSPEPPKKTEELSAYYKHLEFRLVYLDPFRNTWDDPLLLIPKKKPSDSTQKEIDRTNEPVYVVFKTATIWIDQLCHSKKAFEDGLPESKPLTQKEAVQQTISHAASLVQALLTLPLDPKVIELLQKMLSQLSSTLNFSAALSILDRAMGICVRQGLPCHR